MDWMKYLEPLFELYGSRKHPLDYKNRFQLVVMVILSAQDSDKHINEVAKLLFEAYPSMASLAQSNETELQKYIGSVMNFANKSKWLITLANSVKTDEKIPTIMEELIKLPGIGRKSANVIIRETNGKAEGIIVDLHVVRVAPRIGIANGTTPVKIEKLLMEIIPRERWNDAGMAISFLGREVCRPTNPKCDICVMNSACHYHNEIMKK
jgi:endonuclease-3